ncbi:immunoglobulin-like domain-containing protein [Lactococcus protaetiae]|uniref:DUF5011 domain-containing protein n=1 Tax=Lactococcus protaetiae TaxID=2592653 RepID=A0A514Z850_9LACT|nr:immunoglobulin-like domain-containing protein [Lactococcus protaetiae]QDK70758.1 DUF5011 domain-containing protein [Lactococcus protaetiae]
MLYSFIDKDGSTVQRTLTVNVSSQSALNLKSDEITLKVGKTFDGQAQVASLINSDGSSNDGATLKIDTRQLDPTKQGTYEVTYSFTDDVGQIITKTLTVNVVSGAVIHLTTSHVNLTCGDSFDPKSYIESAFDSDGKTPFDVNNIQIDSTVNTTKAGNYKVTYSFTDNLGNLITNTLRVYVQNKASLTLTTNEITLTCGDSFSAQSYFSQALNSDGKTPVEFSQIAIDSMVNTTKAGDVQVVYSFVDSSGQTQSQTLLVHILDKASLTLLADTVKIHAGNEFNPLDFVVSALDSDGKTPVSLSQLTVNSNVNMQQAGTYQAVYSFVNSSGNVVSQTLTIAVYGEVLPTPVIPPVLPTTPPKDSPIAPVIPTQPIPPKAKPNAPVSVGTVVTLPSFVDSNADGTSTADFETPSSFLQSSKKDKDVKKSTKDKTSSQPTDKTKTLKQAMIEADSQNKKNHKKNNVIQTVIKILGALITIGALLIFLILKRKNKASEQE